jgi:hypothetical protein
MLVFRGKGGLVDELRSDRPRESIEVTREWSLPTRSSGTSSAAVEKLDRSGVIDGLNMGVRTDTGKSIGEGRDSGFTPRGPGFGEAILDGWDMTVSGSVDAMVGAGVDALSNSVESDARLARGGRVAIALDATWVDRGGSVGGDNPLVAGSVELTYPARAEDNRTRSRGATDRLVSSGVGALRSESSSSSSMGSGAFNTPPPPSVNEYKAAAPATPTFDTSSWSNLKLNECRRAGSRRFSGGDSFTFADIGSFLWGNGLAGGDADTECLRLISLDSGLSYLICCCGTGEMETRRLRSCMSAFTFERGVTSPGELERLDNFLEDGDGK